MTLGTLRDQVIYPDTLQDYRQKGITDGALEEYLKMVSVVYMHVYASHTVHVHVHGMGSSLYLMCTNLCTSIF